MGRESGGTLGAQLSGIYGEGVWRDTWSSAVGYIWGGSLAGHLELSCRVYMGRESGGTLGAQLSGIYGETVWRDTWSSAVGYIWGGGRDTWSSAVGVYYFRIHT